MKNSTQYLLAISIIAVALFATPSHSEAQTIVDGDLITSPVHHNIYIVKIVGDKKFKRLILNPDIFNQYDHLRWKDIKTVSESEFGKYKLSSLIRELNDNKVYRLFGDGDAGSKRWMNISSQEFEDAGFDWDSIYISNEHERDSYEDGLDYNSQNLPVREFDYGIVPGISSSKEINKITELGVDIVRITPNNLSFIKDPLKDEDINIMVQKVDDKSSDAAGLSPPSDYEQWAENLKKVVQQHPDVKYWQVWNEPNEVGFWYPNPNATEYVDLLRITYNAIKEANPDAVVINGGLSGINPPKQYLRDMYAAGAKPYFDVLALHPYGQPNSPDAYLADYLNFMKNIMNTYGDLEKDIWITEIGWPTDPEQLGAVSEEQQAEYLRRSYEIAYELDFVKKVFWYRLQDAGEGMGIIDRPAEDEYKQLAN